MTDTTFQPSRIYTARSACDHDCVFRFIVTKCTAKTITFIYLSDNSVKTKGIKLWEGVETCLPLGSYSMAPAIRADRYERGE